MNHTNLSLRLFIASLAIPTLVLLPSQTTPSLAATANITINAAQSGPRIPKSLYGVFLEDISHAGEGGLYGELIQNRGFEDANIPPTCTLENGFIVPPKQPSFWEGYPKDWKMEWNVKSPWPAWSVTTATGAAATSALDTDRPLTAETAHSMRLNITQATPIQPVSLVNEGFWGIGVRQGASYNLSFFARVSPNFRGLVTAQLVGQDGKVLASAPVSNVRGANWKKYSATLTATSSAPKAKFALNFGSVGVVNVDFVSLFPAQTFKNRPNGMRLDLAQKIAALKPAFVRWPGGCVVEGITIGCRPQWKQTIGPLESRVPTYVPWGYWVSNGIGYHEYLQFCEDVGADAVYVANVGVSCAFRSGTFLPDSEVPALIQDSLDAIEYAIGPVTSKWGALRAKNGHPKPFPLKYFEVGNEQSGERYGKRVKLFKEAIKAKYPQIQIALSSWIAGLDTGAINAAGPIDIVDEHAYKPLNWAVNNFDSFATYDRTVPWKLYIGEFATNSNVGAGNMRATVNDAAYMMSMEKNSDIVHMGSYAPLLVNINDVDWGVNLIHFDADRSFGRASYYACQMFADNLPNVNLKTDFQFKSDAKIDVGGGIGVGTWDTAAEYKDISVETEGQPAFKPDLTEGLGKWRTQDGNWQTAGGTLSQKSDAIAFAFLDNTNWKNATLTCKARKLSGREGFLVTVGYYQGRAIRVNIGGWGNSQSAIQFGDDLLGTPRQGGIETNRWYDIKVQVDGPQVRAWLDGQLLVEATIPNNERVLAIAGRDEASGDIIIKAINNSGAPVPTSINVNGVSTLKPTGTTCVLASTTADGLDENSFEQPTKIVPIESKLEGVRNSFEHTLPPFSVTILRLKTK